MTDGVRRFKLYDLVEITPSNGRDFRHLAHPRLREGFPQAGSSGETIAWGASIFAIPVGLAYASFIGEKRAARLHSLFVLEKFRNKGIGTALLQKVEEVARGRLCQAIHANFTKPSGSPEKRVERLFEKTGWEPPQRAGFIYKLHSREMLEEKWMNLPPSPLFQIGRWAEATGDELDRLKAKTGVCYDVWHSPFDRSFDTACSLCLKCEGDIVGWVVTEKISAETVLFHTLYVFEGHRGSGKALALLSESVKLAYRHYAKAGFHVRADNVKMQKLVKKLMGKYVDEIVESFSSLKRLPP